MALEPNDDAAPESPAPAWRRWSVIAGLTLVVLAAALPLRASSTTDDNALDEPPATRSRVAPLRTGNSTPRNSTASETTSTTVTPVTAVTTVASSDSTTVPAPAQDPDAPAVVARPIPLNEATESLPPAPPPPWAASWLPTGSGHVSTHLGCVESLDAVAVDQFLASRIGPVMGWDYQHVYALGADTFLWLFQDVFIDQTGAATTLGQSDFVHNAAMLQVGNCFRLVHGGTTDRPEPFEPGDGRQTLRTWFWPMGGEVHGGQLTVFWVKMVKDAVDPQPPDGLGWHPAQTWIGTYDADTLRRLDFRPAPNPGVNPVYGYAVSSDAAHTYLFGNTFEQNLAREGGFSNGPHSATTIFLARVPRGSLFSPMEYRTTEGWSPDPAAATPVLERHWAEFPMQPRFLDGRWIATTAVDGYWGDRFELDVAHQPWGPWTTVTEGLLVPRDNDPRRNTYHAHLAPWRDSGGNLVVTVSNNARNMLRDAWPDPSMYRPMAFTVSWPAPPPVVPASAPSTTTSTSTTVAPTTTTIAPTTTTSTTTTSTSPPPTSTTSTTIASTTTTTTSVVTSDP